MGNKPLLRLLAAAVFAWAAFTRGETIVRAQAENCDDIEQFCISQMGNPNRIECDYYPDQGFFCTECCYYSGGGFCTNCWWYG